MIFSEYVPATGQIMAVHTFSGIDEAAIEAFKKQDSGYVEGLSNPDLHYFANGQIVDRPTQSTTLVGTVLTAMPIPATLYVDGAQIKVDDGEVELDLMLPGTYKLRVEAFPYKDWEGEVTV